MASRFAVGITGIKTWTNADTSIWSATSGGGSGASVPGAGDTVTLDANSGNGVLQPNYDFTVTSITMGAFGGALDFSANNNNPTMSSFFNTGTGARTLYMGNGTWTLTGTGTVWNTGVNTNLNFNAGSSTLVISGATQTLQIGTPTSVLFNIIRFTNTTGTVTITGNPSTFTANSVIASGTVTILLNSGVNWGVTSFTANQSTVRMSSNVTQVIQGNGQSFYNLDFNKSAGTGSLSADLICSNLLSVTQGNFNANNFNVTCANFNSSNTNTRSVTMGSGTWTLTGTSTVWDTSNSTGLTLTVNTSTIKITDTSSSSKTFAGGSNTFNNLWFTGGTGVFNFGTTSLAMTFNDIRIDSPSSVQIFAGKVITATSLTWSGTAGTFNTFYSSVSGTPWTISVASGTIFEDYISLQDSTATGGATFYAGGHSTDVSGNTGWIFGNLPVSSQNAGLDENHVSTLIGSQNNSTVAPIRVYVNPLSHALVVDDANSGTDFGPVNVKRDENGRTGIMGVSSTDGTTPIPVYVDASNHGLLINSN